MTSKVDAAVRRGMDLAQLGARDHEWLSEFDKYVTRRARRILPNGRIHPGTAHDSDDLEQIGRIGAWRTGSPDLPLQVLAAKQDMIDAVKPAQKHTLYQGYRLGTAEDTDEYVNATYATDDAMDDLVIAAYHAGELHKAISNLSPRQREYVQLRFFKQLSQPEIAERFGYDPRGLWRVCRARLLAQLEHLR